MQKQLFLTSSVHAVAHDIASKLKLTEGNKLVFIDTAAEPEKDGDISWLENDRQALVDSGFEVTDYTITGKTADQIREDLEEFKYLYLSGGNTLYLLEKSYESGFIEIVRDLVENQGRIYIGTSAGSIIAGPKQHDLLLGEAEKEDFEKLEAYNFVNFLISPHWGSPDFRDKYLGKRLKMAYREDQVPMILLTDKQYVHVSGDTFKIYSI